jgi:hypothetical protein
MEPFFPGRPGLGSHKGCAGHGSVYDLAPALMEEVKNVDSKVKSSSNACRAWLGGGRSALQGEEDMEKQMERLNGSRYVSFYREPGKSLVPASGVIRKKNLSPYRYRDRLTGIPGMFDLKHTGDSATVPSVP